MAGPTTVDEYLATLPTEQRAAMDELRRTITAAAPGTTETIAYQIPGLRLGGRLLVSYAAFKRHYSVFPASDVVVAGLGDEITPYLAGKGTVRFPADQPIPTGLVRRIVELRVVENGQAARRSR